MLKKGPDLKMPDIKIPDPILDIYYDLRERRLLPLVAILIVALIALPFVLGGNSSDSEPAATESAVATTSTGLPTSSLVVAKSAPGLRDYRRRLGHEHAKDPFIQHYAGSSPSGGEGESGGGVSESPTGSEESSSISVESTETAPELTESTPPSSKGDGEPPEEGNLKYYSFAIDVRVVPASSNGKKAEPSVRQNLPQMTMLPSREVPALTFVGVTKDEKKAVMLVSDKVTGLFGDAVCIVGSEACQLVALEPGLPETVVYGDDRTYRIELVKLRLLKTDKLNTASLGKPKQDKNGRPRLASR